MRRTLSSFRQDERGTSVMEMVLSLPILVLVMLLLLGLGYMLMAKPRAIVAARYAAQYGIVHGSPPSSSAVAMAVGERGESWHVSLAGGEADDESVGELERTSNESGDSGVAGFFSRFLNVLSGRSRYIAVASTRPRRGILPRLMNPGEARGAFIVEHDSWNCDKNRGSYLTLITSQTSSSIGSVPILGSITNAIDGIVSKLPCCETYQSR